MRAIELWTAAGAFVAVVEIALPPDRMPEAVLWEGRVFTRPSLGELRWVYRECYAVAARTPAPGGASFTCPRCGAVSHNPTDAKERYCGKCHVFVDDDPRGVCPGCGEPALDGKVTCGRASCGSSTGQDRPLAIEVLLADAVALEPPVSVTLRVRGHVLLLDLRPVEEEDARQHRPSGVRVRHVVIRSPEGVTLFRSGGYGMVVDADVLEVLVLQAAAKLDEKERRS